MLPTLIDERQTTFIEGQHLLHSTLIANEVIHEAKSRNRLCLVFKADFEKAYDSVSWDFLLYMLRRMNFCEKWILWIEGCLKSASMSIWKLSFFHNKGELWARILDSKYGDWRNLEEATRGSRVSTWWKDINIIDPLGADGSVFDKGIKWKVGCGEKTKFWEYGWVCYR